MVIKSDFPSAPEQTENFNLLEDEMRDTFCDHDLIRLLEDNDYYLTNVELRQAHHQERMLETRD